MFVNSDFSDLLRLFNDNRVLFHGRISWNPSWRPGGHRICWMPTRSLPLAPNNPSAGRSERAADL